MAVGLRRFGPRGFASIQKHLLPSKTADQLIHRYKNRSGTKAGDNPLKQYREASKRAKSQNRDVNDVLYEMDRENRYLETSHFQQEVFDYPSHHPELAGTSLIEEVFDRNTRHNLRTSENAESLDSGEEYSLEDTQEDQSESFYEESDLSDSEDESTSENATSREGAPMNWKREQDREILLAAKAHRTNELPVVWEELGTTLGCSPEQVNARYLFLTSQARKVV